MAKELNGKDLFFISRILRDGSGVEKIEDQSQATFMTGEVFKLNRLSVTEDTYIASGFNSYVVKLKTKDNG